jgi:hypothetical protein
VKSNFNGIVRQMGGRRIQMFSPDTGAKQVSINFVRGTQAKLVQLIMTPNHRSY